MDMEQLPVIYRKESDGSIVAFFPTEPADTAGRYIRCYAHIGQWGAASFEYYWSTRPAAPDEYATLERELRAIYEHGPETPVRLVPYKRRMPQHMVQFLRNRSR